MSHKINCMLCFCECRSDEMIYEDYRKIDEMNHICELCYQDVGTKPLITKGDNSNDELQEVK